MPIPEFSPIRAQLAKYLRGELMRGRWRETMPGRDRLAEELGINPKTVEAALVILEEEGVLVSQGAGRRRRIELPDGEPKARPLRVAILIGDSVDRKADYVVELQHQLLGSGHDAFFTDQSMGELRMDLKRIARLVKQTGADAWVVCAGTGEALEWFAAQQLPAIAMFGRRRGILIAGVGPDKPPVIVAATRRLIELGHRRIVMLTRAMRKLPAPGASEQAFLDELAAHGLLTGAYNLPDWEETKEGFHHLLDSLFRVTPPTALVIDEVFVFVAAQQHLARKGILAPENVSLVCTDPEEKFAWCEPSVAHIRWDSRPVVRRIVRWAANVSRGEDDRRQTLTKAEFIEGGTVGPAPTRRLGC